MPEHADILDLLAGQGNSSLNRLAFECLVTGMEDARVLSLLHVLGWDGEFSCFALGGTPAGTLEECDEQITRRINDFGGREPLVGIYDNHLIVCARVQAAVSPEVACTSIIDSFSESEPVYLSPERTGMAGASRTIRETLYSLRAASALSNPPRPIRADELLPERALLGDELAHEELYENVYRVLHGDSDDDPSFQTVSTFLHYGGSLEMTAKQLNVHPNTVRYRLKRAAENTGWDATDPRDAFVLNTAIAIGRMRK